MNRSDEDKVLNDTVRTLTEAAAISPWHFRDAVQELLDRVWDVEREPWES
jgi:hypothetical protein